VNGKQRGDECDRPATIAWHARELGGVDISRHGYRLGFRRESKLVDDALVGIGRGEDRCRSDVPGNTEYSQRAGDRDDPDNRGAWREHQQQQNAHIAKRGQRFPDLVDAPSRARDADRVTNRIKGKPSGHHNSKSLGGQERRIDQEERDDQADDRAGRSLTTGRRCGSTKCVQRLDRRGKRKQPPDVRYRRLCPGERRQERERAEGEGDGSEAGDGGSQLQQLDRLSNSGSKRARQACWSDWPASTSLDQRSTTCRAFYTAEWAITPAEFSAGS
jgi:hypothetical protein